MLGIKVHQVKDLKPNDEIVLNEKKTKQERRITLNRACISAIRGLLASKKYTDEDFLFTGQRGVLTVPTVNQKVKSWYRTINLKGNFGGAYFEKNFRIPPTGFIRNRSANPDGNFQSQHSETDPILSLCSA
jgi:integrase